MEGWTHQTLEWLARSEGPWAYGVLGLAAAIEYLLPFLPGDSIALFGVFLAVTTGYRALWVYLSLDAGALVGSLSAYGVGRALGKRRDHPPRFLQSQRARKAIDSLLRRFERHGAMYLAINRFVPGLRAFFFVAAGMAGLPWWQVAIWGLVSASVWNALLLGAGWLVGDNFERLQSWVATYTYAAIAVLILVIAIAVVRWWRRRASANAE